MIDVITGGRLITGMVRGIGAEYFSMGANPAFRHERFHEAHDLVVQAWTKPGPFAFEGKHYHFEYVNVWPRPYQQPHPPIWCPSLGTARRSIGRAHPERRYVYIQNFSPVASVMRYLNLYRQTAERLARLYRELGSDRLGGADLCRRDRRAGARRGEDRISSALFTKYLNLPFEMMFPPGYLSAQVAEEHARGASGRRSPAAR